MPGQQRGSVCVVGLLLVLVGCVGCVGCGPTDSGTEVTATPCKTDFECPAREYCDPATKVCTATMPEDNLITGKIHCLLDAAVQPDPPAGELGKLYVSGALLGEKAELTRATACVDRPTLGLVEIALVGRTETRKNVAVGINLPIAARKQTGTVKLDPYVNYVSEQKHPTAWVWDRDTKAVLAYGFSGTIEVTRAATASNAPLELKIELRLKIPVKAPTCAGPCVSQADCGPGKIPGPGADVIPYAVCFEEWEGGPRSCRQSCGKDLTTDCTSTGGQCVVGECFKPRCAASVPKGCDKPPDDEACDYCCNEESKGGMDRLYGLYVYPLCACDTGAPCSSECASACTTHASQAVMDCWSNCLSGIMSKGATCITAALTKCKADTACAAYFACLNKRCPL